VHCEPVEDGGREGGIAEIASPLTQGNVAGHGGGGTPMPSIDQVVEGVGGCGLVVALFELTQCRSQAGLDVPRL
jgi:hypothetical protein